MKIKVVDMTYEQALAQPDVYNDQDQYRKLTKAHADLRDVVELFRRHRSLTQELEENKQLLHDSDPDIKAMAQEEIAAAEAAKSRAAAAKELRGKPGATKDGYHIPLLANVGKPSDGKTALEMIASHCPDLLLLDLGLPDMDGMTILRNVRKWSKVPILVVSARSHERDKVEALDAGADDYLTKPFGTVELLARIRTALRHTRTDGTSDGLAMTGEYHVGDLCIDYNKHRVFLAGEDTHLTPNEYKIVALLGRHAGQVLTYKSMMKELWGPGVGGDNKLLRVHMANIRRKIEPNPVEPQYIFTEVGVGYRMADSH